MAEIAIKTNHSAVSLHFCCNDILYLNVPVLHINGKNQISSGEICQICQICTEKWGSRHEKLSMRPITGKPHAQVQTKIQSTAGLWVPSLELASHGAHAQSTI